MGGDPCRMERIGGRGVSTADALTSPLVALILAPYVLVAASILVNVYAIRVARRATSRADAYRDDAIDALDALGQSPGIPEYEAALAERDALLDLVWRSSLRVPFITWSRLPDRLKDLLRSRVAVEGGPRDPGPRDQGTGSWCV